jgi:hypothetical protein
MGLENRILNCNTENELPTAAELKLLPRDIELIVVFGPDIAHLRKWFGEQWIAALKDFKVGIHVSEPKIWIHRLVSEEEIVQHKAFLAQCAVDFHFLATDLMSLLGEHLKIDVSRGNLFEQLHRLNRNGQVGEWQYNIHGFHCSFFHRKTEQVVEASIVSGQEFGALDPYFFTQYIESTSAYQPLPVVIFQDYDDGLRIMTKLLEMGLLREIDSEWPGRKEIVSLHRGLN